MENVLKAMAAIVDLRKERPSAAEEAYKSALLADLSAVTAELSALDDRYNLTSNDDMLEACIYEELALKAKFRYLLCLARAKGISYGGDLLSGAKL